jgi:hypothetical protein
MEVLPLVRRQLALRDQTIHFGSPDLPTRFMHHACELARPTAGIAALALLETAATCRICHVN